MSTAAIPTEGISLGFFQLVIESENRTVVDTQLQDGDEIYISRKNRTIWVARPSERGNILFRDPGGGLHDKTSLMELDHSVLLVGLLASFSGFKGATLLPSDNQPGFDTEVWRLDRE